MEEAGCKIIYGFEDYKVHFKICLITAERGAVRHITQVGTGNYNEKTAKQYTDVSLITADERYRSGRRRVLQNMALGNLSGRYSRLFVAPTSLKNNILALMDEQIAKGKNGHPAQVQFADRYRRNRQAAGGILRLKATPHN